MKIIKSIRLMQEYSRCLRRQGKRIGLVPTMGYLHEGHLSLVRRSVRENDKTVVSVFVNPMQFGPREDFKKYPRAFKRDEEMLRRSGVDVLFYPSSKAVYPEPYYTTVNVEYLTEPLCDRSRPGHFRGVTTVVAKLFNITTPDSAYFGRKDAQQAAVIKKMAVDLNMGIKIVTMPIVREKGGLAMSSRNAYLSEEERRDAAVLYEALALAKGMIKKGRRSSGEIKDAMRGLIRKKKTAKIDYIEIVNEDTFKNISRPTGKVLIALAVYIGRTRLIDNIRLKAGYYQ
ncbi:MAG: pantoate--beta-alanine ligase [Candidatus Omnitrophica bacterium]|nr:pantoate--beta-alanine ligase [Candidatus Omnitrophota bacterium]